MFYLEDFKMLLALVRFFCSVVTQLQRFVGYKLHQLELMQVQKLQPGSPERESEQGQGEQ